MAGNETDALARYCAIESTFCTKTFPLRPFPSCFVAYPSGKHWSQMMRELVQSLRADGIEATRWEDLAKGGAIFAKICDAIHAHRFTLCDVTEHNANVLFEAGYSLASNRDVIFLVDKTKKRVPLQILSTKEQCFYATREDIQHWLSSYVAQPQLEGMLGLPHSVWQMSNFASAAAVPNTVYYIRPSNPTQVSKAVFEQLSKSPFTISSADPQDTTYDDFYYQARQIQESELVVGLLTTSSTQGAEEQNAPVCLLLGLAVGLGKRVLVLQELPNQKFIDLGPILYEFEGEDTARRIVDRWTGAQINALLQSRNVQLPAERGQGRATPIQDLFLGSPDAMADYNLMSYFITTSEYRQVRHGDRQLLIGRKGAGKSATFQALQAELGKRKTGLLVTLAPSDFEFERLTGFLEDQYSILHHGLVYESFWRFILFTEILKVINERHLENDASPFLLSPMPKYMEELLKSMSELEPILELDFASRAIRTLDALQSLPIGDSNSTNQAALESVLLTGRMYKVEKLLQAMVKDYPITIIVDDIDKHWNPSYEASVYLLLGLVNAATHLRNRSQHRLNITLFLRQDIFEFLRTVDDDIFKRDLIMLAWNEGTLLNMIAERIRFQTNKILPSDEEAWVSVLPGTIKGVMAWRYVIERSLMRPRDVLQFCQMGIARAQSYHHARVTEEDMLEVERDYSYNVLKGLRLEYTHMYPRLDEVAFEFLAWHSQGSLEDALQYVRHVIVLDKFSDVEWVQACLDDPKQLLKILYSVGFCGIGDTQRSLCYYSYSRLFDEAIALCYVEPFVIIHPAFRGALELS